jgi:hypothetical protein
MKTEKLKNKRHVHRTTKRTDGENKYKKLREERNPTKRRKIREDERGSTNLSFGHYRRINLQTECGRHFPVFQMLQRSQ